MGLADPDGLTDPDGVGLERTGRGLEAVAVGCGRGPGSVEGLNVATESMAPATRQTARILASSGSKDPCPAKGDASLRSLRRRRRARSSRW